MKAQLIAWMTTAWQALSHSNGFMAWNLFLAFVPLALSVWLFRKSRSRSILWWAGFLVFLAFLPNAPYVLTDTIHLIDLIRQGYSAWIVSLVLIPQYLLFILAGFEAYVLSVMNLGYYWHQQGQKKYILEVELIIHALCGVGIYLGRFKRFNSWDFVTQPDALASTIVNDLVQKWPILVVVITFVVLSSLYWLMKQVNLGIIFKMRYQKTLQQRMSNK
ncbi:MAG: DUF1361 domain-containing protein [Xenococcaceae cyanobacterium]